MHAALARMIVARLEADPEFQARGCRIWHLRAPVRERKPYVLFGGEADENEEDASGQVVQVQPVQFTVVGDNLEADVKPLAEAVERALEDYTPDLSAEGVRVMRSEAARRPIYDLDDDGGGHDVFVAGLVFRFWLQRSKG